MPTIKLDKSITVRIFPLPPPRFEPLKAKPRDLLRYGFPPRPKNPHLLRRWEAALSRPIDIIQPRFHTPDYVVHKLPTSFSPPAAPPPPPPMRTNYIGGATATAAAGQGTIRWIEGTLTLPDIYLPGGGEESDGYSFSTWIGIFGETSNSSLLAGWDSYVYVSGRNLQRAHYTWWQWAPGDTTYLSNFFVQPGRAELRDLPGPWLHGPGQALLP